MAIITIYASSSSACPRKIMFDKLHLPVEISPYIQRRIFDGNLHEASILEEAHETLGLRCVTPNDIRIDLPVKPNGCYDFQQFRLQIESDMDPDIDFVGKIDDLAIRKDTNEYVLLEAKAVGLNTWIKLITNGVWNATPYYYEQVQLYLWMLQKVGIPVNYGYLVVRNVDTKNKPYDFRWFRIDYDPNYVHSVHEKFAALKPVYAKVMASKMLSEEQAIQDIVKIDVPYSDPDLPPCELCWYRDYCFPLQQIDESIVAENKDEIETLAKRIVELQNEINEVKGKEKELKELKNQLKKMLPDTYEMDIDDERFGRIHVKKYVSRKPSYKWGDILKNLDSEWLKQFAKEQKTEFLKIEVK